MPVDSISSVATASFKTIAVATSSGVVAFRGLENYEQIFNEVNKLISQRRERQNIQSVQSAAAPVRQQTAEQISVAEELKKFKELYEAALSPNRNLQKRKNGCLVCKSSDPTK